MLRRMMGLGVVLMAVALPVTGQQSAAPAPNKLLAGKLIYVKPMPADLGHLDQWIIEDLRVWARYRRTNNPEGVDLLIEAVEPERSTDFEVRGRSRRPRPKKSSEPGEQCSRLKPGESPAATINLLDWVTGERLWYAHLIDKKFKKEQDAEIPAGPHTDVYIRGLTPDQTALKLVTRLREYVADLERSRKP